MVENNNENVEPDNIEGKYSERCIKCVRKSVGKAEQPSQEHAVVYKTVQD